MNSSSRRIQRSAHTCGVHADGHDDFMAASGISNLHAVEAKLERRIENQCHPKNAVGCFVLILRKRRLLSKIKKRLEVPYAMFLGSSEPGAVDREYDALNDYGLGRDTTPTSIGGAFLKTLFSQLPNTPKKKQNKAEMATPRKPSDHFGS